MLATTSVTSCGSDHLDLARQGYPLSAPVERWRKPVERYFRSRHVTWALNIIACESGGDPDAYNASSGASGLFQQLSRYWPDRAAAAGFSGASPFDPEANIATSAYLLYAPGGGPQHWACEYSPFEEPLYTPRYYDDNGQPVGGSPDTCPALPSAGGVVDDASDCFELFGPESYWRTVDGVGHGRGLHWTNAVRSDEASNWARWNLKLSRPGRYRVDYFAVATYAVFAATRYVVRHGGKHSALTVNQSIGADGWRRLGVFDFATGDDQHVAIYDNTRGAVAPEQHIVADAIRLEREVAPASPDAGPSTGDASPGTADSSDLGHRDPDGGGDSDRAGASPEAPAEGTTGVGGCQVDAGASRTPSLLLFPLMAAVVHSRRRRRRSHSVACLERGRIQ